MMELKERLKCKPFEHFLQHVDPDNIINKRSVVLFTFIFTFIWVVKTRGQPFSPKNHWLIVLASSFPFQEWRGSAWRNSKCRGQGQVRRPPRHTGRRGLLMLEKAQLHSGIVTISSIIISSISIIIILHGFRWQFYVPISCSRRAKSLGELF